MLLRKQVGQDMGEATFEAITQDFDNTIFQDPVTGNALRILQWRTSQGIQHGYYAEIEPELPYEMVMTSEKPRVNLKLYKGYPVRIGEEGSSLTPLEAQVVMAERDVAFLARSWGCRVPNMTKERLYSLLLDTIAQGYATEVQHELQMTLVRSGKLEQLVNRALELAEERQQQEGACT